MLKLQAVFWEISEISRLKVTAGKKFVSSGLVGGSNRHVANDEPLGEVQGVFLLVVWAVFRSRKTACASTKRYY